MKTVYFLVENYELGSNRHQILAELLCSSPCISASAVSSVACEERMEGLNDKIAITKDIASFEDIVETQNHLRLEGDL